MSKHTNSSLPPVNIWIYLEIEGEFKRVIRDTWATSRTPKNFPVRDKDGNIITILMKDVKWHY